MKDIHAQSFLRDFWEDRQYSRENYQVEAELNRQLPQSYLRFMRFQNGGIPVNTCLPATTATSWAKDHIEISGFFAIGKNKPYSLLGQFATKFWIEERDYKFTTLAKSFEEFVASLVNASVYNT